MAVTPKVQMCFKPKVAQQIQNSKKPSTSKDDNTCIIEEHPTEKVQLTLHLQPVTKYLRQTPVSM